MDEQSVPPVEVPVEALSADALNAVIDSFIQREGTDYGREEMPHEAKVERIRKQLSRDEIKLVFDAATESVTFLTKRDWEKLKAKL